MRIYSLLYNRIKRTKRSFSRYFFLQLLTICYIFCKRTVRWNDFWILIVNESQNWQIIAKGCCLFIFLMKLVFEYNTYIWNIEIFNQLSNACAHCAWIWPNKVKLCTRTKSNTQFFVESWSKLWWMVCCYCYVTF